MQSEKEVVQFAYRLFKGGMAYGYVHDMVLKSYNITPALSMRCTAEAEKLFKREAPSNRHCNQLINGTHWVLEVFKDGERARETGDACPWPGGTLENALHAAGWVSRDLRITLDQARKRLDALESKRLDLVPGIIYTSPEDQEYVAQKSGTFTEDEILLDITRQTFEIVKPQENFTVTRLELSPEKKPPRMVEKVKGYRFPGVVIAEFKTRKGKDRVVVEGVGDGNDECLHIFSPNDLRNINSPYGWTFRYAGVWNWTEEYPERHDADTARPATEAERRFAQLARKG